MLANICWTHVLCFFLICYKTTDIYYIQKYQVYDVNLCIYYLIFVVYKMKYSCKHTYEQILYLYLSCISIILLIIVL